MKLVQQPAPFDEAGCRKSWTIRRRIGVGHATDAVSVAGKLRDVESNDAWMVISAGLPTIDAIEAGRAESTVDSVHTDFIALARA